MLKIWNHGYAYREFLDIFIFSIFWRFWGQILKILDIFDIFSIFLYFEVPIERMVAWGGRSYLEWLRDGPVPRGIIWSWFHTFSIRFKSFVLKIWNHGYAYREIFDILIFSIFLRFQDLIFEIFEIFGIFCWFRRYAVPIERLVAWGGRSYPEWLRDVPVSLGNDLELIP